MITKTDTRIFYFSIFTLIFSIACATYNWHTWRVHDVRTAAADFMSKLERPYGEGKCKFSFFGQATCDATASDGTSYKFKCGTEDCCLVHTSHMGARLSPVEPPPELACPVE